MNPQIQKLYQISQKPARLIIGLMSGTSLDGLDVALCRFQDSGQNTKVDLVEFETVPYTEAIKKEIKEVFAKNTINFPLLCMLNPWIGNLHASIINDCLKKWDIPSHEVDLIASHGQTVMHQPKRLHGIEKFPNSTLQLGDGDHIAMKTGIITISDFRQKHCAAGGEGAPLALYGDFLLFSSSLENRILINIGGIANYTYLPKNGQFENAFATDTGPGNTIIDAFVQKHFQIPFDKDAQLAKSGKPNYLLLKKLKEHLFFEECLPKTTGPELFNLLYLDNAIRSCNENISNIDVLNTLCYFSAETICESIISSINIGTGTAVYLSGGGMHNPLIVDIIKQKLPLMIMPMEQLGISGDAKEAILFAALANECIAGQTGFTKPVKDSFGFYMGKISLAS
jgi:anhydro-N-acetylmuramic acid kinase